MSKCVRAEVSLLRAARRKCRFLSTRKTISLRARTSYFKTFHSLFALPRSCNKQLAGISWHAHAYKKVICQASSKQSFCVQRFVYFSLFASYCCSRLPGVCVFSLSLSLPKLGPYELHEK